MDETAVGRVVRCVCALDRVRVDDATYDVVAFASDEEAKSALRYADIFVRMLSAVSTVPAPRGTSVAAANALNAAFVRDNPDDAYVGHYYFNGFPHKAVAALHDEMRRTLADCRQNTN